MKIPDKFVLKPPFRIGIRAQLTALVSIVACVSLMILAITTGVYFTANYKNLRSDRLYIAAQLKSSQIDQTLNYLYYQCYYVSSRDTLQYALTNYVAGNKSNENWADSASILQKFLSSSNLFSVAKVYDASFTTVLNVTNNGTGDQIPDSILAKLLPLSTNIPLSSSLETTGILTDPVLNSSTYLMSMSLPIFANPSVILAESRVYGYLTVVMSAEGLRTVFNDTTALEKSNVAIVSAVYNNVSALTAYRFVFAPMGAPSYIINSTYRLTNGSFLSSALREGKGGSLKSTKFFYSKNVAIGYSPCTFSFVNWVAVVSQAESVFLSPSTKLAKIIAGTVVAIGVFVFIMTFPLAHWAVKPIVRLQKATELISEGRGLKSTNPDSRSVSRNNSLKLPSRNTSHYRNRSSASSVQQYTGEKQIYPTHSYQHNTIRNMSPQRLSPSPLGLSINRHNHNNDINNNNNNNNNISPDNNLNLPLHGNNFQSDSVSNLSPRQGTPELRRSSSVGVFSDHTEFSTKSGHLTTSANLIEARVPDYRRLFSDELSDLTDTFNTMTDALDQHYALLEDRVRARTKQLEAAKIEAERANEAKTVFIANISHELRTPLNGILGMTAISMEETDISKIRSSLKLIFRSGELLLHILTELLTFSKNVLKRTTLEKRDFCITDVALQIKSIFGKVAKDQRVKLSITLTPNTIRTMVLYGDSNRIIQIVMNLVSNALKFTPVDGKVNVKVKLIGEYDEALSAKNNFKEVYVKQGTELLGCSNPIEKTNESIPSPKSENNNSSSTTSGKDTTNSETSFEDEKSADDLDDEKIATKDAENENTDDTENLDEQTDSVCDNISLVSTSTSSYDDAIFNSQFKKSPGLYDDDENNDAGVLIEDPKTWVIQISVEDTGPGIDKTLQESVFQPFVQGDQTLSRQYGGTGLGLSICRQLANMMHGTMKLKSEVGVGSTFTFTVPLKQTREINFDDMEHPFEDEFNPESRKNRKVKFKLARSIRSKKSRASTVTFGTVTDLNHVPENEEEIKNGSQASVGSSGSSSSDGEESNNSNNSTTHHSEDRTNTSENTNNNNIHEKEHKHKHEHTHNHSHNHGDYPVSLDRPFLQSTGTATSSRNVPVLSESNKDEDPAQNIKILVAEDNHVNQEVIKRMLNLEGVNKIDLACDGQEAFDKVKTLSEQNDSYNIIFMDVQMPKVDGLLSTKMIRKDLHYDHPIVALTAFADDSNIKECLESGMNGFLSKPIKRPKLRTIIKEYCPGWKSPTE
ncbi:histidine kinase NDAI_0F00310 [Naumovozyma dairenensis CBS 421]|uniref:histidine kinase n=1 Tax=Naumovozyma dairenensis (strain ATCC 10597 / BCRC 20456 / CBS 421 / NBRC 0211 / NRRL Y-12639) TaxID=1071378 RepID=G0WC39_NAUDC|nr:hypothetical protein NDAI_0F00310 [Naumovozyma dairenensis CBS 421]CCD25350.1 hypothetical protein NDAI_0F00310 [Naumovozyma dairenensis CBS 421]